MILVGRNRAARQSDPIRAVLGVRGEPSQPQEPSQGLVWSAIVEQIGKPGSESEWVSAENAERSSLAAHPWSLSGGGSASVVEAIEKTGSVISSRIDPPVGRAIRAGAALRDGMRQPRTLTVNQLADLFRTDEDMHAVAALYAADHLGKRDLALAQVLAEIVAEEHVPYLAALRYKPAGLRKRAEWEQVWEMQREEDRTGTRLDIPVPPKYSSGDVRKTSYWSHRGKLDVPKERFTSYPSAGADADPSMLLGWAG